MSLIRVIFLIASLSLLGFGQAKLPSFIHKAPPIPPSSEETIAKRDSIPAGYVATPYYPAPKGGWVSNWTAAYAKAQTVVAQMTLAEKVNLTTGIGELMGRCVGNTGSVLRFGIPSLCLQDSALGIAATDFNTAFPAGITTGATWSKDLAYQRGLALGAEARGKGVNILLGPTVGMYKKYFATYPKIFLEVRISKIQLANHFRSPWKETSRWSKLGRIRRR